MKILRSFLLFGVILGGSLNIFPCKSVFLGNSTEISSKLNFIGSFLLVAFVSLIGSIFTSITSFLTLAGIIGGTFIAFLMPGMMGIKSNFATTNF